MRHSSKIASIVCGWFVVLACSAVYADAPTWRSGLSDRELAIQRWFSWLTFQQDRGRKEWTGWYEDKDQLSETSLRYQIAFAGYGCAAMAAKTPAYRELVQQQLDDLCQRLIDVRTWYYVTRYWTYKDRLPDPCLYENVMYTGHVAQLMCLYELLTGDMRYTEQGWDFVWRDGRKIHYTLRKTVEHLRDLSKTSPNGGICCEPGLVFPMCNDHSAASLMLFDLLHKTHYSDVNARWFGWMSKAFRDKTPNSRTFLYCVFSQKLGLFLPVSDVAGDGWTLGWGYPWFPSTEFAREGWQYMLKHADWRAPKPDEMYAEGNAIAGCCGGKKSLVRNAFFPLLAVQVEGADSPSAKKIMRWFDAEYSREADTDGDGHNEAYYYEIDSPLRIPTTGNLAAALATDGDSLRRLFTTPRTEILAAPRLAHVDYPNILVRTAEYIVPTLRFTIVKGKPGFQGKTELVCKQVPAKCSVTRDGKPVSDFRQDGSTVIISTDVDKEHVFELTGAARSPN